MIVVDIENRGQAPDIVEEFAAGLERRQHHPEDRVNDNQSEEQQGTVVEQLDQIRTPEDPARFPLRIQRIAASHLSTHSVLSTRVISHSCSAATKVTMVNKT